MKALAILTATSLVAVGCGTAVAAPITGEEWTDCSNGYVALLYDDGPTVSDQQLLDALHEEDIRATFFLLGEGVAANPDIARRIVDEGHWIGTHSWSHPDLTQVSDEQMLIEVYDPVTITEEVTGVTPTMFRFPFSISDERTEAFVAEAGLEIITLDLDSWDWDGATASEIAEVFADAQDGSTVTMHSHGGGRTNAIEAVPLVAAQMRDNQMCPGRIVNGKAVAPEESK